MRRVIISGGGTGGHIYPAITIARAIADIEPTEFLYVGSKIGFNCGQRYVTAFAFSFPLIYFGIKSIGPGL